MFPVAAAVVVSDQVRDREFAALDPERAGAFHCWIDHDAGVRDHDGLGRVVWLVDGTRAGGQWPHEEVLEGPVPRDVGGLELGHVDVVEVDEALDVVCGAAAALDEACSWSVEFYR